MGAPFLRVLVVEDVRDGADSLAFLLNVWGYTAAVAYDGAGAIAEAEADPPDVVLLDIGLPGMDGCELSRRLRRLPGLADALLVAVTGFGQDEDVRRCKEAGIDHHLVKPVATLRLRKLLAEAEGRRQLTF